MAKYHINGNGEAKPCRANPGNCRFQTDENHYSNLSEARSAAEDLLKEENSELIASKSKTELSIDLSKYSSALWDDETMDQVAAMLKLSDSTELASIAIEEEDLDFVAGGETVVRRFKLSDGRIAYFKPMGDMKDPDFNPSVYARFGQTPAQAMVNEVLSHHISKMLGYGDLVPETALREIDGQIGSLQVEASGTIGCDVDFGGEMDLDSMVDLTLFKGGREALIFDTITAADDRHDENYFYDKEKGMSLIDNSLCLSEDQDPAFYRSSEFTTFSSVSNWGLKPDEIERIEKFKNDFENSDLSDTIKPGAKRALMDRLDKLLKHKRIF